VSNFQFIYAYSSAISQQMLLIIVEGEEVTYPFKRVAQTQLQLMEVLLGAHSWLTEAPKECLSGQAQATTLL